MLHAILGLIMVFDGQHVVLKMKVYSKVCTEFVCKVVWNDVVKVSVRLMNGPNVVIKTVTHCKLAIRKQND